MAVTESFVQQQYDSKLVNNINMNPDPIDLDECLKDSPKFRHSLKENLAYIEHLESCMSRTIKQISNFIETGQDHIKAQSDFINSMRTLNNALGTRDNKETSKNVNTLLETLEEIKRLHEIVIDQSARTVGRSFSKFINDDLVKLREARKSFDKISHEYDQALIKYSQPVKKQQEDSENLLIATSTAFTHTSLDLSIQLTTLQSKKGFEILGSLLSFLRAHGTFFHQGLDLFEDLKPHISDMDMHLSNVQDEFETSTRNLPSKHLQVSNNELRPLCFDNASERVHLEGYLFKRASNGFKVWNRRWFILKDHQLIYQKRGDTQPIVMEEDLRLLTVRPVDKVDNDRRFCFEVVSPQKSHILQADSEASCKTWIGAIQAGINAAFHDTDHKTKPKLPITNETTTATSSWSSSFSLKALQQQATSKLNSIATLSDLKDISKSHTSKEQQALQRRNNSVTSGDEDDQQDSNFKVDEQGRSYAPLRDDDDETASARAETIVDEVKTTFPEAATTASAEPAPKGSDPPEKPQRAYMIILAMPGNDTCADCGAPHPRWASINLGITLCIECAGIHRSLGVHLSKVRSLTLDTEVWSPEIVQLMLSLGNISVNSAYLACHRGQAVPIGADSNREERENWIKSKYLEKKFMRPPDVNLDDSCLSSNLNETVITVQEISSESLTGTNGLDEVGRDRMSNISSRGSLMTVSEKVEGASGKEAS